MYLEILDQDSVNAEALQCLGWLRYQRGEADIGLSLMKQAVNVLPQRVEAFHYLGNAYLAQNDYLNAKSCFERAIEFHPRNLDFRMALVRLYSLDGNHEALCRHCQATICFHPEFVEAYNDLGLALRELGQPEASLNAFTKALEVQPLYVKSMVNLANMLREQGRLDEALSLYRRAILLRPEGLHPITIWEVFSSRWGKSNMRFMLTERLFE